MPIRLSLLICLCNQIAGAPFERRVPSLFMWPSIFFIITHLVRFINIIPHTYLRITAWAFNTAHNTNCSRANIKKKETPEGVSFRVSKKWLNATFLSFTGFASRIRSRAAKSAKYENLWVFIRSDAHVVRAGLNIRGCGPLSTLGFFDRLKKRL